jgi:hypothetical protein
LATKAIPSGRDGPPCLCHQGGSGTGHQCSAFDGGHRWWRVSTVQGHPTQQSNKVARRLATREVTSEAASKTILMGHPGLSF